MRTNKESFRHATVVVEDFPAVQTFFACLFVVRQPIVSRDVTPDLHT